MHVSTHFFFLLCHFESKLGDHQRTVFTLLAAAWNNFFVKICTFVSQITRTQELWGSFNYCSLHIFIIIEDFLASLSCFYLHGTETSFTFLFFFFYCNFGFPWQFSSAYTCFPSIFPHREYVRASNTFHFDCCTTIVPSLSTFCWTLFFIRDPVCIRLNPVFFHKRSAFHAVEQYLKNKTKKQKKKSDQPHTES